MIPKQLSAVAMACFTVTLSFSTPAAAQEQSERSCAEILASPPLVDVLTRNGGKDWGDVRAGHDGDALLGVACTTEDFDPFFFAAEGWKRPSQGKVSERTSSALSSAVGEYFYNQIFGYTLCLAHPFWQFWARDCPNSMRIYLLDGRVTNIDGGGKK